MLVTLLGIVTFVRLAQTFKRPVSDVGDAVGDCVTSAESARIYDERGLALVEQDSIDTAIDRVVVSTVIASG